MIKYLKFKMEIDYWVRDFSVGGLNYDLWEGGKDKWDAFRRDCPFMIEDESVMLLIDVTNGRVVNWKEGVAGEFTTVKIVDRGSYQLLDENMSLLCGYHGYVPDLLGIVNKSWGDYLEFRIGKDCFVEDWKCNDALLKEFIGNCDEFKGDDEKIEVFFNKVSSATTQKCQRDVDIPSMLNMAVKKFEKKYPVGIQTFSEIIREGYVYVDKTDLVWQLAHYAKFIFLSRPRRFGKSLLSTTLESYFKGDQDLFDGLKIIDYEQKWEGYPVIHLDLSTAKGRECAKDLRQSLMFLLRNYLDVYGRNEEEETPGQCLTGIIQRACEQTGKQVVVLVDEYDAPLLDVLHEGEMLDSMRKVMQEFYQPLKASEARIKFCFITGITKFSQLSIFSTINNLKNVTMLPQFSAICGFTENEVKTVLAKGIEAMAAEYNCSAEVMFERIKMRYDGYHFSEKSEDIYNPYSLLNAFTDRKLTNYWFESGTPTFLIRQMQHFRTDIMSVDRMEVFSSEFDQPTEAMQSALPLLYQSGYLTIKDYDEETETYTLSIPNQEVRIGYVEGLLPAYTGLEAGRVKAGFAMKFWLALKRHDVDLAMREMQAYLAGIPYVEGFKQKLQEVATAEGFYEYTMYLIFSTLNFYVRTQVKCAGGRTDMVVWMPDAIYVFEMKVNGTAQEALQQIDNNSYAIPYQTDGRPVVKVGVKFDVEKRIPEEWVIA